MTKRAAFAAAPLRSRVLAALAAVLAACVAVLFALALSAAPASAAGPPSCTPELVSSHQECRFGEEGHGAGQFSEPRGIAVDQETGDVYIVDSGNNRVDKFGAEGKFLLAWGWGVADGKAEFETCGPAASPPHPTCLQGLAGSGAGQFFGADGVAVNNGLLSVSHGDVYVEDNANHRVQEFKPNGEFVLMFGGEVNGATKGDVCLAAEAGECQAGVSGGGEGQFGFLSPGTVGVDSAGSVYVGDSGRVQEFNEAGVLTGQIALAGAGQIQRLVVAGVEDVYVMSEARPGVRRYEGAGGEVGPARDESIAVEFNGSSFIALGVSGELFVYNAQTAHIDEFEASGTQVGSFPEGGEALFGGAATGMVFGDVIKRLYMAYQPAVLVRPVPPPGPLILGESSSGVLPASATLEATVNPEGAETTVSVEYGTSESYGAGTTPQTLAAGFEGQHVTAPLSGLSPSTTYHFRVVASSHCNPKVPAEVCTHTGADQEFTTLPPVSIDSESVSEVSGTSARLGAELNAHGVRTEYRFQYGHTTAYELGSVPASDALAGSGSSDVGVGVLLEGLEAGREYHYRVIARNSFGESTGEDRVFTTRSGAGEGLLDGRGWEMVSPPDKHGVSLESLAAEGSAIQAAGDGSGLAYVAKGPIDSQPEGNRAVALQQLLATRGAGGWSTRDIATAHEEPEGLVTGSLTEYKLFSTSLSGGLVEPEGSTPLSALASERTPYIRRPGGEYTPLVYPGDVSPPGTKFGVHVENGKKFAGTGVEFVGASTDLNHVVLRAPQSLVEGFETGGKEALYEWSAGKPASQQLQPVSILPGSGSAGVEGGAQLGNHDFEVRNAVSADGARVFFETLAGHHLFVREVGASRTVQLDGAQEGAEGGKFEARYQDASVYGSKVFFTDEARLTKDATGKSGQPDLYMCEVAAVPVGEHDCGHHLKDLTVDGVAQETANVLGGVLGASEDGGLVYFVANGVLRNEGVPVAGAVHGNCTGGEPGSLPSPSQLCNLYTYDTATGHTTLVAVLSNRDFPDWAGQEANFGGGNLGMMTSRVSPNGRFLAFMSQRSLTGYDNEDVTSRSPGERMDEEVFLYDSSAGRVACASCDPTGARPAGILDPEGSQPQLLIDKPGVWGNQWVAATLPAWTHVSTQSALYQSRFLSNEGRLFFNTPVGLVPQDSNGRLDVYEFEPQGLGGCTPSLSTGSAVYVKELNGRPVEGCVGLVSSGTSSQETAFLDASESGEDVFFLTAAKLAGADFDSSLDVYDAHVCSAASPCPSGTLTVPPACSGADSCRGAPAPQPEVFGAPASATFSGPGNVTPSPPPAAKPTAAQIRAERLAVALKLCRRDKKKARRTKCERTARSKYGAKKAKKKK